jgi:hypothetical protein
VELTAFFKSLTMNPDKNGELKEKSVEDDWLVISKLIDRARAEDCLVESE